ncbi:Rossmann-like and DUF2520 domain-containing protein [Massilia sp. CF038]|uniref:Rossmann-like and DUF2520 domain-containing protein n=1 Tax=Massilia sp. CF038 TaxID=1881045 RepID=UPI0009200882|nr:Rossmann-like and DUF2520 domain-containing protein [Massilia sp. CF038]SHH42875.1 Predicted oxidoreductase, contains short-chain dehydrogenase (SDR) and DUF2520 domains [Massilia sp. CF038]
MAPTLNIVGAGKVGRTLGRLFAAGGSFVIQDVLTRSPASAHEALHFIGAGTAAASLSAMRPAQVWMLAAGDDQLAVVGSALAARADMAGTIVFHCSGARSALELASLRAAGAMTASVHPIRSFADPAQVAAQFEGTFCGVEGDSDALAVLLPAFAAIGARCVEIDAAAKTVYHAASVFASNYLVTVLDAALRAYQAAGISESVARELAAPLAQESMANVFRLGAGAALTGPIARGDFATVARQQAALDDWDGPSGELYRALAVATTALAQGR